MGILDKIEQQELIKNMNKVVITKDGIYSEKQFEDANAAILVLKAIFDKSGYSCSFENVNIDLVNNSFSIKGR